MLQMEYDERQYQQLKRQWVQTEKRGKKVVNKISSTTWESVEEERKKSNSREPLLK